MWDAGDIRFDMIDDLSAVAVVTVVVSTPAGTMKMMAEPEKRGRTLHLLGLHLQESAAEPDRHGQPHGHYPDGNGKDGRR